MGRLRPCMAQGTTGQCFKSARCVAPRERSSNYFQMNVKSEGVKERDCKESHRGLNDPLRLVFPSTPHGLTGPCHGVAHCSHSMAHDTTGPCFESTRCVNPREIRSSDYFWMNVRSGVKEREWKESCEKREKVRQTVKLSYRILSLSNVDLKKLIFMFFLNAVSPSSTWVMPCRVGFSCTMQSVETFLSLCENQSLSLSLRRKPMSFFLYEKAVSFSLSVENKWVLFGNCLSLSLFLRTWNKWSFNFICCWWNRQNWGARHGGLDTSSRLDWRKMKWPSTSSSRPLPRSPSSLLARFSTWILNPSEPVLASPRCFLTSSTFPILLLFLDNRLLLWPSSSSLLVHSCFS